jgi:TPR repeat protein
MLRASAGLIALLFSAPLTGVQSRPVCRDARDCNVAGTRALGSGQMAAAEAAFKAQVRFAWCADDTAQRVLAHNNLAILALRRGEPLQARVWASLALKLDPKSPAALFNARLADERAARLPSAQGVTGTYWSDGDNSLIKQVMVQELSGGRIRFELWASGALSCVDMWAREGEASGRVVLTGHDAVWETQEFLERCRLRFSFGPDEITLTQDGLAQDCGFGGEVYADGTYRRTSRQPPHFTRGGSAMAVWKDVCDGGGGRGCTNLGAAYEKGEDVPKDLARAAALYQRGCDGKDALGDGEDALGCFNLGLLYAQGAGVPKDVARAAALYKQGCDRGYALGCFNLGVMYQEGVGVFNKDATLAASFLGLACDSGVTQACELFAAAPAVAPITPSDLPTVSQEGDAWMTEASVGAGDLILRFTAKISETSGHTWNFNSIRFEATPNEGNAAISYYNLEVAHNVMPRTKTSYYIELHFRHGDFDRRRIIFDFQARGQSYRVLLVLSNLNELGVTTPPP